MRRFHGSLLIGLLLAASPAFAADASHGSMSSDAKAVGTTVKRDSKEVGSTVKHDAKVFGVAVKHAAIKIGHAAKKFGLKVAAATKEGVHEVRNGTDAKSSDGKSP